MDNQQWTRPLVGMSCHLDLIVTSAGGVLELGRVWPNSEVKTIWGCGEAPASINQHPSSHRHSPAYTHTPIPAYTHISERMMELEAPEEDVSSILQYSCIENIQFCICLWLIQFYFVSKYTVLLKYLVSKYTFFWNTRFENIRFCWNTWFENIQLCACWWPIYE